MGAEAGLDLLVARRRHVVGEDDLAAAADAVAERAQAIRPGRAVTGEAAVLATGRGLARLVQRAVKVPSRCSSAFEVFWAAGSDPASVAPGAGAYGKVVPPPSGNT
jgi:hypothetical protein